MSRTLPPGWYPDPDAPLLERRWDGTAWTDHRRAPEAPGPPRAAGRAAVRARAVALTACGTVLVAAIVSGALALARGDGDDVVADTAPTVASPTPTTVPPAPAPAPSRLDDELDGISLPLPDGWVPSPYVTPDHVVMTTDGGRVFTHTLPAGPGTTAAALARRDVPQAADTSYGGIRSHRVVRSERVAVMRPRRIPGALACEDGPGDRWLRPVAGPHPGPRRTPRRRRRPLRLRRGA